MKDEYAINFAEYEVKAALENRKSQARRIVKPVQSTPKIPPLNMYPWLFSGDGEHDDEHNEDDDGRPLWVGYHPEYPHKSKWFTCPWGKVGTQLWARETFLQATFVSLTESGDHQVSRSPLVEYAADGAIPRYLRPGIGGSPYMVKRPSSQMPRWASRLAYEIVNVRVERIQDITEKDILAEGVTVGRVAKRCKVSWSDMPTLHDAWRVYWEHVHGLGAWERNAWVWAIDLKRVEE